ncbi:MAG: FHA domain-containing protein [bacterium]
MATLIQYRNNEPIHKYSIKKQLVRIGRDPDNDVCIHDKIVGKDHAVIEVIYDSMHRYNKEYYIQDLESSYNTYVNGKRIKRHKLHNNDVVRIGKNTLRFIDKRRRRTNAHSKIYQTWTPRIFYSG